MANQKRLSLLEKYLPVLDTDCRKKLYYFWGASEQNEGIKQSRKSYENTFKI